MIIHFYSWDCQ